MPHLAWLFALTSAEAAEPRMRVHFIDVGQGAATLVELPCGAMLVDAGGEHNETGPFHSNDALKAYLTAFFARRADLEGTLDLLLLTHPHIDHVRGAETVLRGFNVVNVVDNGHVPTDVEEAIAAVRFVRDFVETNPNVGYQAVSVDDFPPTGAPVTSRVIDPFKGCKGVNPKVEALWGGLSRDPGWGDDGYGKLRFANENNHSVVTRIEFGEASVLITGDLEETALPGLVRVRPPAALDADVYVVGHHGSANGTTPELLDAVTPEWAVLQVGPPDRLEKWTAWQHGHPRRQTIDRLEEKVTGTREPVEEQAGTGQRTFVPVEIDKAIYATGWGGTVVLEAGADGVFRLGEAERPPG